MHVVVIGGGVAGVSCTEELLRVDDHVTVTLISGSSTIKGITNYVRLTDALEAFDIEEKDLASLSSADGRVRVIQGAVRTVNPEGKTCTLDDGRTLTYDKLCLCSGAAPKLIADHPLIVGLRDTQTVEELAKLLSTARRVMIVGNGGIALGLVHEITGCEVVWAIKDAYIGNTFFDASASAFFLEGQKHRFTDATTTGTATAATTTDVATTFVSAVDPAAAAVGPTRVATSTFIASAITAEDDVSDSATGTASASTSDGAINNENTSHASATDATGTGTSSAGHVIAYDWHTDAPLPPTFDEHCSCGVSHALAHEADDSEGTEQAPAAGETGDGRSGASNRRRLAAAGGISAGGVGGDDDEREFIPTYAVLPKRERRGAAGAGGRRRAKGTAAETPTSGAATTAAHDTSADDGGASSASSSSSSSSLLADPPSHGSNGAGVDSSESTGGAAPRSPAAKRARAERHPDPHPHQQHHHHHQQQQQGGHAHVHVHGGEGFIADGGALGACAADKGTRCFHGADGTNPHPHPLPHCQSSSTSHSHSHRHVHGSSLGPCWTQVLRGGRERSLAAAEATAYPHGVRPGPAGDANFLIPHATGTGTCESSSSALPSFSHHDAAPAAASAPPHSAPAASPCPALAPVTLERSVTVRAMRGRGDKGQTGFLADGAWHAVQPAAGGFVSSLSDTLVASEVDGIAGVEGPAGDSKGDDTLAGTTGSSGRVSGDWPLHVLLSNGHVHGVDFIVSATGVLPSLSFLPAHRLVVEPGPPCDPLVAAGTTNGGSSAHPHAAFTDETTPIAAIPPTAMSAAASSSSSYCSPSASAFTAAPLSSPPPHAPRPAAVAPPPFLLDEEGGLIVNQRMQTSGHVDIHAAGDVACVRWPRELRIQRAAAKRAAKQSHASSAASASVDASASGADGRGGLGAGYGEDEDDDSDAFPLWFQMRLWSQARMQGMYAARCIANKVDPLEADDGGLAYEMFAHMTRFLGHKVVLLGAFNGQGMGEAYERALSGRALAEAPPSSTTGTATAAQPATTATAQSAAGEGASPCLRSDAGVSVEVQLRQTPGQEYVKVVIRNGRVVGAMLIGETDLEETMENLILNRLQLRTAKKGGAGGRDGEVGGGLVLDLLDPDVDLEDYFD